VEGLQHPQIGEDCRRKGDRPDGRILEAPVDLKCRGLIADPQSEREPTGARRVAAGREERERFVRTGRVGEEIGRARHQRRHRLRPALPGEGSRVAVREPLPLEDFDGDLGAECARRPRQELFCNSEDQCGTVSTALYVSSDTLATLKSTASQEVIALGLLQAAGLEVARPTPRGEGTATQMRMVARRVPTPNRSPLRHAMTGSLALAMVVLACGDTLAPGPSPSSAVVATSSPTPTVAAAAHLYWASYQFTDEPKFRLMFEGGAEPAPPTDVRILDGRGASVGTAPTVPSQSEVIRMCGARNPPFGPLRATVAVSADDFRLFVATPAAYRVEARVGGAWVTTSMTRVCDASQ
jgi:hypothetical protein